jgi:CheY-like chemotaxis protein
MKTSEAKVWLLVEDDENDYLLLQRALKRADPEARLAWVRDGAEAKAYLSVPQPVGDASGLPWVILSDLKMPRCSGLELVQWLRRDARYKTVPFIIFSSSEEPKDVGLAYQDGANWYLSKPATFGELVEMLRRLAENLSLAE